jgi:hypothetical protein
MKLLLECLLKRPGGTHVDLGGQNYHFSPNSDPEGLGRHVCEVEDTKHAQRLLGIPEGYQILELTGKPAPKVSAPAPAPKVTPAVAPAPVVQPTLDSDPERENHTGDQTADVVTDVVALPTDEELAAMDIEQLRAQAEKEMGRKPSLRAKEALLISQILSARQPV